MFQQFRFVLSSFWRLYQRGQAAMRIFFVGVAFLVMAGLGLAYQEMKDPGFIQRLPDSLQVRFLSPMDSQTYNETYKTGTAALNAEDWETAKKSFASLKDQQNDLQPLALINLSRAFVGLGREGEAQSPLERVLKSYPQSRLSEYALYLLGQSHMRASQFDAAAKSFEQLVTVTPNSELAVGSRYYLGDLAIRSKDTAKAANYWRDYLAKSEGSQASFSLSVAQNLMGLKETKLNSLDAARVAKVLFDNDYIEETATVLKQSTLQDSWLTQAQLAIKNNKVAEARQILINGLKVNQSQADGETGVRLLLKNTPANTQQATLKALLGFNLPKAGDLVLWQLINRSKGAERNSYIQTLLAQHPKSDWGPESSWLRMWPAYEAGQTEAFIQHASQHLTLFPYSRSAPRVLFWRAKAYFSQGKTTLAEADLSKIASDYPMQFYAYRAKALLAHNPSPWRISHAESLPARSGDSLNNQELSLTADPVLDAALNGLFALGEMDEAVKLGDLFATPDKRYLVEALGAASAGKANIAIRTLRDGGFEAYGKGQTKVFAQWPQAIKEVWYPLYKSELMEKAARKEGLSPYLVLALTRQESAFDSFAISSSKAMGLMQLLPSTAQEVAQQLKLPDYNTSKLFIPEVNVQLGSHYLKGLHARFNGNSIEAVGAYNGGPGAMSGWKATIKATDPDLFIEKIPYDQTRDYIKAVYGHYWNYLEIYARSANDS